MPRQNNSPDRHTLMPTHNIDISLPLNTKYESGNLVSRFLIRGFMRALIDFASQVSPRTVLDVGCGEGVVLRQLGVLWDKVEIHGIDISVELLRVAQRVASRVDYLTGNVYQLPLPRHYYDLVICTEVLEHLANPETALAEIVRVGKGYCLLSVPREPWWRMANLMRGHYLTDGGNTPGHVSHWSSQGFIRFVKNYVDVVAICQPFPWTVVLGRVP